MYGISTHRVLAGLILAFWVASWMERDARSFLAYELPAAGTLITLAAASFVTPTTKSYTLMPLLVLLVAGALHRFASVRPLYLTLLASLVVNFALHAPVVFDSFFYWGETAALIEAHADQIDCAVWASPSGKDFLPAADMVDTVQVEPFGQADGCDCDERWFMVNHITEDLPAPPLPRTAVVLRSWPTAIVGTMPCEA